MAEKEYIEREPIEQLLKTEIKQCERDFAESEGDDRYEQAVEARMTALLDIWRIVVNKAAADVVEVVRCKDCKHWLKDAAGCTDLVGRCEWANYMVGANGYCVYGEAKMDGKGEGEC